VSTFLIVTSLDGCNKTSVSHAKLLICLRNGPWSVPIDYHVMFRSWIIHSCYSNSDLRSRCLRVIMCLPEVWNVKYITGHRKVRKNIWANMVVNMERISTSQTRYRHRPSVYITIFFYFLAFYTKRNTLTTTAHRRTTDKSWMNEWNVMKSLLLLFLYNQPITLRGDVCKWT